MKTNLAISAIILIALIAYFLFAKKRVGTIQSKYKAGQMWNYKTRPQDPTSMFTVFKVDTGNDNKPIVHISVAEVHFKSAKVTNGSATCVDHMPFSEVALDQSIIGIAAEIAALPPSEEGYLQWKTAYDKGKAGVFSIPVAEALDCIEKGINQ